MADGYKQTFVRIRSKTNPSVWFVHPDLRQRVIDDAAAQGVTANEVILRILCERNGVPYEPKPHKQQSDPDPTFFNFRMPRSLLLVVSGRATAADRKVTDVIRQDLCGHYGLPMPAPQVRPRQKRATAAA